MRLLWLCLFLTLALTFCVSQPSGKTAAQCRDEGDAAVAKGDMQTAVRWYTEAIDLAVAAKSVSFLDYYKRAIAYRSSQRMMSALQDLDRAIELNPTFLQGYQHRGKIHTTLGNFVNARQDAGVVLKTQPNDAQAQAQLHTVSQAEAFFQAAEESMKQQHYPAAIQALDAGIEFSPYSAQMRLMRANAYFASGDFNGAHADTGAVLQVQPTNLPAYLLRGRSSIRSSEFDKALEEFRLGLRQDPEYGPILKERRILKQLLKHLQEAKDQAAAFNFRAAVESYEAASAVMPEHTSHNARLLLEKCQLQLKLREGKAAIRTADRLLGLQGDLWDGVVCRAQAHELLEDWDAAVRDWQTAFDNSRTQENQSGLQNAQRRLKMSQRKDHYKILGVARDCSILEIKRAYRNFARDKHPDKFPPEQRAEAQKIFVDINNAYEILSNDELRGKFDRGEDMDEQQQGQGFNPFQGGFPGGFTFQWG